MIELGKEIRVIYTGKGKRHIKIVGIAMLFGAIVLVCILDVFAILACIILTPYYLGRSIWKCV